MLPGAVDHIRLDHQVLIYKLSSEIIVGFDPANPARSQENDLRFFCGEKSIHRSLLGQIEFSVRASNEIAESSGG